MIKYLTGLLGRQRKTAVILHDLLMVIIAWSLVYFVRVDFSFQHAYPTIYLSVLIVALPVQAAVAWWFGLYRGLWRFASIPDLWNIIRAVAIGFFFTVILLFLYNRLDGIPRSSLTLYPFFLVFCLGTPRLVYRMWKDHSLRVFQDGQQKRVLIIGAGNSGETLVREMLRDGMFQPVGLLDDSPALKGVKLHGIEVLGAVNDLETVAQNFDLELVVIAISTASSEQMQYIVSVCENVNLPFWTLPPIHELVEGSALQGLRQVSIEDLLGREPINLDWEDIRAGLTGKRVMITGGGGSIGSELCRQVARLHPAELIIYEQSEFNLYTIEMELRRLFPQLKFISVLGSILDTVAVDTLFSEYKPDVVFHAAAYKHVPMLEDQVRQAARNNILGTRNIAEAADKYKTDTFVLISTDKAVNPANYMGASKRVAEIFCQTLDTRSTTNFITVRFGNVLGSAGSVVPLFTQQIEQGGPVTVTHPDIERYFMTIPEASQLILQAAAMGKGGEIYVLDMGKPVRIAYLAEQMIRLSGKTPNVDIKIKYIGLRPGEKLYEELFHTKERLEGTSHEKILLARHRQVSLDECLQVIAELEEGCENGDEMRIKKVIQEIVPEMQNDNAIDNSNVIIFEKIQ